MGFQKELPLLGFHFRDVSRPLQSFPVSEWRIFFGIFPTTTTFDWLQISSYASTSGLNHLGDEWPNCWIFFRLRPAFLGFAGCSVRARKPSWKRCFLCFIREMMANSMERSARDPSVLLDQGVDLHLADARWLVGHHEPIYSSTDVVCAVDSVGNLSFGDQQKDSNKICLLRFQLPEVFQLIWVFNTLFLRGFHVITCPFFLHLRLDQKVRALLRGHEKGATRGAGISESSVPEWWGKTMEQSNGNWSWINHRKRTVSMNL